MDASEYRERAEHVKACLRVLLTHEMTLPTLLRCWLGFYEASVRSAQSPVADAQMECHNHAVAAADALFILSHSARDGDTRPLSNKKRERLCALALRRSQKQCMPLPTPGSRSCCDKRFACNKGSAHVSVKSDRRHICGLLRARLQTTN
jgi:hypothetical protein